MKAYLDFYKAKFIRESEEFEGDFEEEFEYEYYSGSGLWYNHEEEGYYPQKNPIEFKDSDVDQDGELVPELVKHFEAEIEARSIGLKTLKYFPSEYVSRLNVYDNELANLEYCPERIDSGFYCSDNKLTSLEGSPDYIGGDFDCDNNLLTDLKGFPREIEGDILIQNMSSLISLNGIEVLKSSGDISLNGSSNLKTLKGLEALENCEALDLGGCTSLTKIDYLPKSVRHLDISETGIKSLRSLADKTVFGIESDYIQDFEKDFYFNDFENSLETSYDQQMIDYLIYLHREGDINDEELLDHLKSIHIDFESIIYSEKYKNIINSMKTINKFKL